jgi:peptide/nickel transport system permease protein
MLKLIIRRLAQMLVIMAVISLVLFAIFDTDQYKKRIALSELGGFGVATLSDADYQGWLEKKGLNKPFVDRYGDWLVNIAHGEFGHSLEKDTEVGPLLAGSLWNTAILAFWVFAIMIPVSLILGVLAGMDEGAWLDRVISVVSVVSTSIPQIAVAVLLTTFLGLRLAWVPTKSAMVDGFDFRQLILPVLTLVIYDVGYMARMTRASMAEVMTSHFIRTAVLKGIPYKRVILRHALPNALIVPFTLVFLQLNWLLSEIVVIEVFFQYRGFGRMLYDAAIFGDIAVVQAAALVAVGVAVTSQLLSDVGYMLLNPRVRFA